MLVWLVVLDVSASVSSAMPLKRSPSMIAHNGLTSDEDDDDNAQKKRRRAEESATIAQLRAERLTRKQLKELLQHHGHCSSGKTKDVLADRVAALMHQDDIKPLCRIVVDSISTALRHMSVVDGGSDEGAVGRIGGTMQHDDEDHAPDELENTETQAAAAADAVAPSCFRCGAMAGYAPARGHGFALSSERQRPPAEPRSPHEPRCRGTTLRREEDHNVDAKPNQGHCGSDHQLVKPAGDGHREDQRFHMEGMEEIWRLTTKELQSDWRSCLSLAGRPIDQRPAVTR